jgi:hypothetical protein
MFDARACRDNAADSLRAHNGRQLWPIAIAPGNHQQIILIDRRGLDRDHHLAGRWRPDAGDIDDFGDLGWTAERLYLDCFHECSLHNALLRQHRGIGAT